MAAGNGHDLLQDVAAVSREMEWAYRILSLPHILLPEVNVVARNRVKPTRSLFLVT